MAIFVQTPNSTVSKINLCFVGESIPQKPLQWPVQIAGKLILNGIRQPSIPAAELFPGAYQLLDGRTDVPHWIQPTYLISEPKSTTPEMISYLKKEFPEQTEIIEDNTDRIGTQLIKAYLGEVAAQDTVRGQSLYGDLGLARELNGLDYM